MDSHFLHTLFFFNLIFFWRHSEGQSVSWNGHTIFDDVASNNNTWTTGLPQLKLEFSSNPFTYSRSGFFYFDFKFKNGSIIKHCRYLIQPSDCSAECYDSAFSCTGKPYSGLLVTLDITNLSEDLDDSFAILTQSTVVPMTTDGWNVGQLKIGVQHCTEKTAGISQSSNFGQPSVSCDYLCSTSLVCADGYSDSSGKNDLYATCQAKNTWEENGTPCEPTIEAPVMSENLSEMGDGLTPKKKINAIEAPVMSENLSEMGDGLTPKKKTNVTCNITECIGCCKQTSTSDQLQYGEQLNLSCCNNISDTYQYICLDGSASPFITCPVTTDMQSSAGSGAGTDITIYSSEVTTTSITSSIGTSSPDTIPNNTPVCIGECIITSSSNGDYELTCLDQRYNKKSLPATKNPDGLFATEVALYCIGYTAGYVAGIAISVIGGLVIVGNLVIVAIARNTVSADGKITKLLGLGIISTVVWAVSIGLLFGLEKGDYDMNEGQLAGCVLGSIACVGAIVSCAWSGMVMKQSKRDVPKKGGQHISNPHADESVKREDRGKIRSVYHPVVGDVPKEGGQHIMSNLHADESVNQEDGGKIRSVYHSVIDTNQDDRGNTGVVYHPVVGEPMKSVATNL